MDSESRHALELAKILCEYRVIVGKRRCGDDQIMVADALPSAHQFSIQPGVDASFRDTERQDGQLGDHPFHTAFPPTSQINRPRSMDTYQQLGNRDTRDRKFTLWQR